MHVAQALSEAFQTGECSGRYLLVEPAVGPHTSAQAYHLAHAVYYDQLAVRVTGYYEVKTIRAKIHGRQYLGHCAGRATHEQLRPW